MNPGGALLVTGAAGRLGRALLAAAARRGLPAVGRARAALDVTDERAVRAALATLRPAAVLNAAAYTDVDRAETEPDRAHAVNARAPGILARACAEAGLPLVHVSTDYVFDGTRRTPWREDDPARPINVYGRTKWEGEEAVRRALERHLILRTSWLFAPRGRSFVATVARLAREQTTVRAVADQWGSPTPADTLAERVLDALAAAPVGGWGTYHLAGEPPASRYDLAVAVVEALRARGEVLSCREVVPVPSHAFPAPAPRPAYTVLDTTRIGARLGVRPISWREALDAALGGAA